MDKLIEESPTQNALRKSSPRRRAVIAVFACLTLLNTAWIAFQAFNSFHAFSSPNAPAKLVSANTSAQSQPSPIPTSKPQSGVPPLPSTDPDTSANQGQGENSPQKTYTAYLSCGITGTQNVNPLACFAGGSDEPSTQLELKNGDQYGLYQMFQIGQLGDNSPSGLAIHLHEHFSIKAQNASGTLILGLRIVDDQTGQVTFTKQVAQYGVIDVSN